MLLARIAVCEEALRRFPGEDQLMTENRRRALAESYFEVGETEEAEELFQSWLAADPRWGFGWIGWAACHGFRADRPKNYGRVEELLRRGFSTPGVRDRDAIAEWLQIVCQETGRRREAQELGQQARRLRRPPPPMTVSRKLELAGQDDEAAVVREAVTVSFGAKGCPSTSFLTPCGQWRLRLLRDRCEQPRWDAMQPAPAGAGRSSRSAAAHPGRPAIASELRSSWLRASRRNDAVPSGPGHPFHAQVDVGSSRLSG